MKKVFTIKEQISENHFVNFEWQKTHGNYLAIFGSNPRVSIYDRHGNLINQINLEGKCVMLDWDQQGDVLAIIDNKSPAVYLWDVHLDKMSKVETGFKDTLSFVKWSKFQTQLAVGTSKGNLLLYNHMNSRKVPILGKHSKKITCGAWSEEGLLALGSEDRTFTLSNDEGETIKQVPLRDFPSNIQFSEIKEDEKSSIKENTLTCTLANQTLFLFKLIDMENPAEVAFQEKYGNIVDYKWFGDGYIMVGFSHGYLVVISTHKKEIGQEINQIQDYKDNLASIGISTSLSRAVTVGDRCVKIHDLNALKELTAIIQLDEDGEAKNCNWSEDGQLLAISTITGHVHVFLTRLPMLASVDISGTKIAHLTSLREVSVDNLDNNFPSKVLPIELEPKFIGVGSNHLGVGMNNQVWYYRENAESYHLVSEQEYMKTVTKLQLNDIYSAAYFDGKIMLQMIENNYESDGKETKSRKLFPEQPHHFEYITSFELTANFLIFSTDKGYLNIFFIEDWNYASEFKHECGISKIFSNEVGMAIMFIDNKSNAFFYSPLDEEVVEIHEFPNGTNKVLWDYKNDENSMILVCTDDKLYTYTIQSLYVDTKKGDEDEFETENNRPKFEIPKIYGDNNTRGVSTTKIKLIGFTKAPFGHLPLFLKNGDIILLNQNGKLVTNVLGTHAFKQALNKVDSVEYKELFQYFHQAIMVNYFSEAWQLAEKLGSLDKTKSTENWKELAKASLKCLDIDFAIRVYRRLGDAGMVFSLLKIKHIEDKNLLAGYIAMFLNDFNLAQDFFLNSSNPGAALNMRRDLLHWDSALQLAKALEPSQIPFISREYAGQLEFIGDYVNAMLNYERGLCNNDGDEIGGNKDLSDHINSCTTGIARMAIRLGDTKRGVMMAEQSNNRMLMKECAMILEQTKQMAEAGALFEKAQYFEKAITAYIRLKNWNKVGQLLKHVSSPKLHLQFAKAREAEGLYKEAVASYELAKDYDSVIRVNLEHLNNPEEAVRIVNATNSKEGAHYVAQFFIRLGDFASAIQFLVLSKCHSEALHFAQEHGQMETYAKIIVFLPGQFYEALTRSRNCDNIKIFITPGPQQGKLLKRSDATIEDYQNIASYFEQHKNHYLAGKFYLLACQYEKAIKHLLKVTYVEDSQAVDLAIEAIGRANDDKLTHYLVEYLMGEYDNIPKNMKYLFKMYMALKQYREAGRTAILIAKEEQGNGNYRMAHDLLFSMMQELKQNNIKIPSEMSSNLMLIHSYIIAKLHIKRGDHLRGARMLIRVAESISKFPSHVVPILTSTVIECHRSGLRDSSFSYAAMLLRPDYRDQIDPKYVKKMETIVRRPDKTQEEEPKTECPFCSNLVLETTLQCNECKSSISYCIASGRHIIRDDCVICPKCEFPAIGSELRNLLNEPNSVCPMCSEPLSANELKLIIDITEYLQKFNQSIE